MAIYFTVADGKKVWVLGNVEEVAVIRGTIDEAKAVGSNSASYLLGLEKDARPIKGTYVNDEKAVFILRWYQEMDKNGKVFKDTYQNKGCTQYYLPLDNGGHTFQWTSNLQAITAVRLDPSAHRNRVFVLPSSNKKTIVEAPVMQ